MVEPCGRFWPIADSARRVLLAESHAGIGLNIAPSMRARRVRNIHDSKASAGAIAPVCIAFKTGSYAANASVDVFPFSIVTRMLNLTKTPPALMRLGGHDRGDH